MGSSKFKYYRIFWGVAFVVLLLDQLSKHFIQQWAFDSTSDTLWRVSDWLSLVYVRNTGAAWGIFSGSGLLLGLLAIVATCAIYFLRKALQIKRVPMQIAFGLMVAGILGNMIDRFMLGYVVDFIDMQFFVWRLLVFNIADVGITVGVSMYIIFSTLDGIRLARGRTAAPQVKS